MGDFKVAHFAIGALSVNEKLIILAIKTAGNTVKFDNAIVKITQHGRVIGNLHGAVVVGILPFVIFGPVAIHAFLAANKCGNRPGRSGTKEVFFLQQVSRNG
jgi:hypothetical protein